MNTSTKPEQRYLSLQQAAASANLSVRTIRRAIAAGRLSAYRVGRLIRISHAEFIGYIQQQSFASR